MTRTDLYTAIAILALILGGFGLLAVQSSHYHQERMAAIQGRGECVPVKQAGQLPATDTVRRQRNTGNARKTSHECNKKREDRRQAPVGSNRPDPA